MNGSQIFLMLSTEKKIGEVIEEVSFLDQTRFKIYRFKVSKFLDGLMQRGGMLQSVSLFWTRYEW